MSETTTFAIGQRVRVIKHDTDGTQQDNDEALRWTGEIGTEGTIDRITDGDTRKLYEFRADDGRKHVAFIRRYEIQIAKCWNRINSEIIESRIEFAASASNDGGGE